MKSILSDFPFFFSSGTNMYMYFQKKKKPSMFILVLFQCLKLKQPETLVALDRQQPVSAVRVRQVFVFSVNTKGVGLKGTCMCKTHVSSQSFLVWNASSQIPNLFFSREKQTASSLQY